MERRWERFFFRVLLLFYAPAFRARYTDDLKLFVETDREEQLAAGVSLQVFWLSTALDFLRAGLVTRRRAGADVAIDMFDSIRNRFRPVDMFARDFQLAVRGAFRRRGFSAIVISTLAIAIGSTTVIFAAINTVLLRSMQYPDAERIVHLDGAPFSFTATGMTVSSRVPALNTIDDAGIYAAGGANLGTAALPVRIQGAQVSAGFFETFNVNAQHGRYLAREEEPERNAVVISNELWRSLYASDPGVIGDAIRLDGKAFSVVGVMPAGFDFPGDSRFWVSMGALPTMSGAALAPQYVARVAPGVKLQTVEDELDALNRSSVPEGVEYDGDHASAQPLQDYLARNVQRPLWILLGTGSVVLLIACLNVTNLYLSQVSRRKDEFVLRAALGARRSRFLAQLFVETGVLAGIAGVAGIFLARLGIVLVETNFHNALPFEGVQIDMTVLGVSISAVVLCAFAVSLAPASYAGRGESTGVLRIESSGMTEGRKWKLLRDGLVVTQLAMALVLVFASGLLIRTFAGLYNTELGISLDEVLTTKISFPSGYGHDPSSDNWSDGEAAHLYVYRQLTDRLESLPEVVKVGLVSNLPLDPSIGVGARIQVPGRIGDNANSPSQSGDNTERVSATFQMANRDYFDAIGIPIVAGRTFDPLASRDAPVEVVVSQTLADRIGPDPVGLGIKVGRFDGVIVGVADHVRSGGPTGRPKEEVYLSLYQQPVVVDIFLAVRTTSPRSLAGLIPDLVAEVDHDLPVYATRTTDELLGESLARRRFSMTMMSFLGSVALVLAVLGVYGTISHSVANRVREIGIRLALDASPARIKLMVLAKVAVLLATGIGVGLLASLNLANVFGTLVFGIATLDPLALGGGVLVVAVAAAFAGYLPSTVAARVDPMSTLKEY